jgi:hypothetical protein
MTPIATAPTIPIRSGMNRPHYSLIRLIWLIGLSFPWAE